MTRSVSARKPRFDCRHKHPDDESRGLQEFVRRLIALRHNFPILRRRRFMTGQPIPELEVKDATWVSATGADIEQEHWSDANMRCFGAVLDGRAQRGGIRRQAADVTLLIILNAHDDVVLFTLPEVTRGERWRRLPLLPVRARPFQARSPIPSR